MSEHLFLSVIAWSNKKLWKFCHDLTAEFGHLAALKQLMEFRCDMQKALAKYARGKSGMDGIQTRAIWMMEMISKWCGHYYKGWARDSILKTMPDLAKNPRKLKGFVNHAWEVYVRTNSF